MSARAIVTGATGFVGRALLRHLGAEARCVGMSGPDWVARAADVPWRDATVFHLAARAHEVGPLEAEFMRDNAGKTRELARMAARGGARRIVFLSTLKVNGEESGARPIAAADAPAPGDAYARSKLAAEGALREETAGTTTQVCIVRCPLVYGRGARGNLLALVRLADGPWPLPFAALDNRRSFIHLDDLAAALAACGERGRPGAVYLVAHREPASTARLVSLIRERLGRPKRMFRVPPPLLESLGAMAGSGARVRRLTRSLELDPTLAETDLQWRASRGLGLAVDDLVAGYREGER